LRAEADAARDTQVTAPMRPAQASAIVRESQGSRLSVPPSEPRASRTTFSQIDVSADRPARLQLIVVLVLFLFLFAIPLYLWRRPRAESIPVATASGSGAEPAIDPSPPAPPPASDKPSVSEPKVVLCQDPGPKRTPAEQCDRLPALEQAFVRAVEESGACARDSGGGAVAFVLDVSFKRHQLGVTTPKEGRTMKSTKAVGACQSAVKAKLGTVVLDSVPHAHARYKLQLTATYPATKP